MANKRQLKKNINTVIFDVIDECIYIQETRPEKLDASETLINEAIDVYNTLMAGIHSAKSKADYTEIISTFEEKADDFVDKLNSLNA